MLSRTLLLFCLSLPCWASEFRVCAGDQDLPPLIYPQGMGTAQYLLLKTTENLQLQLRLDYKPQVRCLYQLEQGDYDAVLTVGNVPKNREILDLPLDNQGVVDRSFAFGTARIIAFKMSRIAASWDGKQFINLQKPLLYQKNIPVIELVISKLNLALPANNAARTTEQLFNMLRHNRAHIALGFEADIRAAMQRYDPYHEFVILEPPLHEFDAFLGLNKNFVQHNPQQAGQIWAEFKRLYHSPEWLKIQQQVESNQLTPAAAGLSPSGHATQPIQPASSL
jgi:hypothetical protein